MRNLILVLLAASCAAVPSLVSANAEDFIPRFYDWGAEVRAFGSYDREENTIDGRPFGFFGSM